jgi:hypothetical protein
MKIFRALAAVLGVAEIVTGIAFLFVYSGDGVYRAIIVPLGFVSIGAYFVNYAITGRTKLGISKLRNRGLGK